MFVIDGVSPTVKSKTLEKRQLASGAKTTNPERKNKGDFGKVAEVSSTYVHLIPQDP